jgi:phage terminase large subunit-like protein
VPRTGRNPATTSSPASRWRPRAGRGPVCGQTFRDNECLARGAHYCEPRADRAVAFFTELLVHTKGRWARSRFILDDWQESGIIRPMFGEVVWSTEWECYTRRYSVAYIVLGRKNGKSELAAGIVLYLLVGDDEESAEVYGAAKDTKQAGKVGEVVERMRQLSPKLAARLKFNKNSRRIYDERTGSYYEVIAADEKGELGHNPHGFVLDEVLSQRDGSLWNALRTGAGTRAQPLFLAITTETNDPASWGADVIDEAERVQEDPARAPHVFAYVRQLPMDADPWDEANWRVPNPALSSFLSTESLRQEAVEARNDPTKENAFRQYRLNQRVSQVTRWMPLHLWDACGRRHLDGLEDELAGRSCFAGLDLASTTDLAAWVLLFPPKSGTPTTDDPVVLLHRFWTPEAQLRSLDAYTGDKASLWARERLLIASEGDWIDYWGDETTGWSGNGRAIAPQIVADHKRFRIVKVGYDQKEAVALAQHMQGLGLDISPVYQGFSLSASLKELMRLVKAGEVEHAGHPVARWNADSAEVKYDDQERIKLVKPQRQGSGKRVDGIAAAANAINVWQWHVAQAAPNPATPRRAAAAPSDLDAINF